ncbi:MAG: S16 family serine protease [Nitrososphaera sp.]|jgi:uncharacterized protein
MARRILAYTLIVIVIVSVIFNYIQYKKNDDLEGVIAEYKKQNDAYAQKLSTLSSQLQNYSTRQSVPMSLNTPQISNKNENRFQSISAVAVKPVMESDGFFETTTYVGTVLKISVETRDGTGLVLVNTAIPTGVDFQTSARTAVMVAQKITNIDLSKKDVIFSVSSENAQDLQAVDGGSAGGAMTVLLISVITNKTINDQVLMTGTIEPDGSIGKIGGAEQKADAAGKFGAKTFLVPQGQAVTQVQTCDERKEGVFVYRSCTLEEKPLSPIMESEYGMKVIEISNITQALSYFNS